MSPKAIAVPVSVQSREVWRGFLFVRKRNVGWSVPGSARAALPSPNRHLATIYFDISPQIEFVRVGVAEGWRRGLRVVMRR
jgi:hypothetical protein